MIGRNPDIVSQQARLFSNIAIAAEFHPRAKAIRFWRQSSDLLCSQVVMHKKSLAAYEYLEADIAELAVQMEQVAIPDFHAFCRDIETVFTGAQPCGPIAALEQLDWYKMRRLSAYAQYWQSRNPAEVNKLLCFVMAMPVYSYLFGWFVSKAESEAMKQIIEQLGCSGNYVVGVSPFKQMFTEEMSHAVNEAKMLVSTYRGSRDHNAARVVNGMLNKMMAQP